MAPSLNPRQASPGGGRRFRVLGLVAASGVLAGVVVALMRRGPAEPSAATGGGFAQHAVPSTPQPPEPSSALTLPLGLAGGDSDFDRLVSEFAKVKSDTVAVQFAQQFMENPDLKQRYEDFQKDQQSGEKKDTLLNLVKDLGNNASFGSLLSQAVQDPAFRAAASKLSGLPEAHELLRQALARAATPAGGRAASRLSYGTRVAGGARGAFGRLSAGGSGAAFSDATDAAGGAVHGLGAAGASPAAGPAYSQTQAGSGTNQSSQAGGDGAQSDAYDVNSKLDQNTDASSEAMKRFCQQYKAFCDGDKLKPEFRSLMPLIAKDGLWGACFEANVYNACVAACQASSGCVVEPAWQSCMDAFGGEETCVRKCQSAGLCSGDSGYRDALARLCAGANPPDFCPAGSGGGTGPGGGPPGSGTITYRCDYDPGHQYNGSNWVWVAQTGCVYSDGRSCSASEAGWAQWGNACPTQKGAVVPRTCRCP